MGGSIRGAPTPARHRAVASSRPPASTAVQARLLPTLRQHVCSLSVWASLGRVVWVVGRWVVVPWCGAGASHTVLGTHLGMAPLSSTRGWVAARQQAPSCRGRRHPRRPAAVGMGPAGWPGAGRQPHGGGGTRRWPCRTSTARTTGERRARLCTARGLGRRCWCGLPLPAVGSCTRRHPLWQGGPWWQDCMDGAINSSGCRFTRRHRRRALARMTHRRAQDPREEPVTIAIRALVRQSAAAAVQQRECGRVDPRACATHIGICHE